MSQQEIQDWIGKQVATNDVVLFMKGTKDICLLYTSPSPRD